MTDLSGQTPSKTTLPGLKSQTLVSESEDAYRPFRGWACWYAYFLFTIGPCLLYLLILYYIVYNVFLYSMCQVLDHMAITYLYRLYLRQLPFA